MKNKPAAHEHNSNKASEPTLVLRRNPWVNTKTVTMYVIIGVTLPLMVLTPGQWGGKVGLLLLLFAMWLLGWWEVRTASITVRGDTIESRDLYYLRPSRRRIYNTKDITVIDAHSRSFHWLYGPTGKLGWLSGTDWGMADMRTLGKAIGVRVCESPRNPDCPSRKK